LFPWPWCFFNLDLDKFSNNFSWIILMWRGRKLQSLDVFTLLI
jgi:hypothetical protein